MTPFLLYLMLEACKANVETCSTPPPPGTGLAADGTGLVHVMHPGFYVFHGATVNNTPGPRWYAESSYGRVQMTSCAPLEWTRPDGKREVVPVTLLYPPIR